MKNTKVNIDYVDAIFLFMGVRKHFLKNQQYHIYVFEDKVVMGQSLQDSNPKYLLKFTLTCKITWHQEKTGNLKSFSFPYNGGYKEMVADSDSLSKMRRIIACKVTFDKISDFYEAQNVLGKGSSAKVLLCKKYEDQKLYAVKSIEKDYFKNEADGFMAFESEVNILLKLSRLPEHNNHFINLYEIFEGEQMYYLVMDLMEGRTLHEELDQMKSNYRLFKSEVVQQIMRQILSGVAIMHQNRIMHRDLKPDNLIFKKKGDYSSLRIVDFGLATVKDVERFMYPKCGTPGFVAPEILSIKNRGEKYTEACDIFSVGVIFYKLLSGRSLFHGTQLKEVLRQNRECKIDFDREEISHINQTCRSLLEAMLVKDPEKRISAQNCLKHAYFFSAFTSSTIILPENSVSPKLVYSPGKVKPGLKAEFSSSKGKIPNEMKKNGGEWNDVDLIMNDSITRTIKIKQLPAFNKPSDRSRDDLQESMIQSPYFEDRQKDKKLPSPPKSPVNKLGYARVGTNKSQRLTSFYMYEPLGPMRRHVVQVNSNPQVQLNSGDLTPRLDDLSPSKLSLGSQANILAKQTTSGIKNYK